MIERFRGIHPIGRMIILGTLFSKTASFMAVPFLAIYLTAVKGFSPAVTGAIIGSSAVIGLFGGFIGGHLSDRYGRDKLMVFGMVLWSFVFLGFSIANHVGLFFLLNIVNGVARTFFEPSSRALLSDVILQDKKLMVFNLRYAAINIGAAVGPFLGLKLGGAESGIAFQIAAGIYFLYAVALAVILPKYRADYKRNGTANLVSLSTTLATIKQDTILLLAIVGIILGVAGFSQFTTTLPQYLAEAPYFGNGIALYTGLVTMNALTVLVVQYPVTRIGKRFSPLFSIMLGTLTIATGLLGIALFESTAWVILSVILFTVGEVLIYTMTDLFVDQIAKPEMKGAYFGAMGFISVGYILGPWGGGLLLGHFGFEGHIAIFGLLAVITSLGFPLLMMAHLRVSNKSKVLPSSGIESNTNTI